MSDSGFSLSSKRTPPPPPPHPRAFSMGQVPRPSPLKGLWCAVWASLGALGLKEGQPWRSSLSFSIIYCLFQW